MEWNLNLDPPSMVIKIFLWSLMGATFVLAELRCAFSDTIFIAEEEKQEISMSFFDLILACHRI